MRPRGARGASIGGLRPGAGPIVAAMLLIPGAALAQATDPWRFVLVPYVWGTGLEGTQSIGPVSVELDASAGDLLEFLDAGGSTRFEARSNPWGWFAEGNYFRLEDEKTIPTGTVTLSVVAAYRYPDTDFEGTGFAWDTAQSGFGIGIGISW